MSTRTELKDFLITDLAALLGASFPTAANGIYFGRLSRTMRNANEIFLRWENRLPEERDGDQLISNIVMIELFSAIMEDFEEPNFQGDMEAAAEILRDTYDGQGAIDRFQTAISRDVTEVNCREITEIEESEPSQDYQIRISQAFALEVKTWEIL